MKNEMNIEERLTKIESAVAMSGLASKSVLTFDEAATFTGLSNSFLYKQTSSQSIPHYKPSGKLIYFNRLELESWLLQNRITTSDEITSEALNYCLSNRKGANCV